MMYNREIGSTASDKSEAYSARVHWALLSSMSLTTLNLKGE